MSVSCSLFILYRKKIYVFMFYFSNGLLLGDFEWRSSSHFPLVGTGTGGQKLFMIEW